jgi:hypothetical protein
MSNKYNKEFLITVNGKFKKVKIVGEKNNNYILKILNKNTTLELPKKNVNTILLWQENENSVNNNNNNNNNNNYTNNYTSNGNNSFNVTPQFLPKETKLLFRNRNPEQSLRNVERINVINKRMHAYLLDTIRKFLYNKNPYKEKIKIGKYDTIDTLITKLKTFLLLEVSEQNKSKAKEYIQNLVHIKSLNNN